APRKFSFRLAYCNARGAPAAQTLDAGGLFASAGVMKNAERKNRRCDAIHRGRDMSARRCVAEAVRRHRNAPHVIAKIERSVTLARGSGRDHERDEVLFARMREARSRCAIPACELLCA